MIALLIAATVIATSGQAAPTGDPVGEARAFLEAFVTDPQATKDMVGSDARIIVDGLGKPYAELLSDMHGGKPLPAGCLVQSLEQKPTLPAAETRAFPAPSSRALRHLALVTAIYQCPGRDGKMWPADVTIYLNDGRILLFRVATRRHGE